MQKPSTNPIHAPAPLSGPELSALIAETSGTLAAIREMASDPSAARDASLQERICQASNELVRLVELLADQTARPNTDVPGQTRATEPARSPANRAEDAPLSATASDIGSAEDPFAALDLEQVARGPSLASILERLRKPAEPVTAPVVPPSHRSLSDEDLFGIEMMQLAGPAFEKPSTAAGVAVPAADTANIATPQSLVSPPEAGESAAVPVHRDLPTPFPDPVPPAGESGADRRIRQEFLRAAASGENVSGDLVPLPTPVQVAGPSSPVTSSGTSPADPPEPVGSADRLPSDTGTSPESDQSEDEFFRTAIKTANREKLELLRKQLAELFQGAENSSPGSRPPDVIPEQPGDQASPSPAETGEHVPDQSTLTVPAACTTDSMRRDEPAPESGQSETLPVDSRISAMSTQQAIPASGDPLGGLYSSRFLKDLDLDEPVVQTPVQPTPRPAPAPRQEQAEPDVEDYMQQLLGRLRSGSQSPAATAKPAAVAAPPSPPPAISRPDSPALATTDSGLACRSAAPESSPPMAPLTPEEFVPRAAAPEKNVNLDTLRQIANESTRTALDIFIKNQKKALYFAQLAGIGGGVMGTALFGILGTSLGWPFHILSLFCLAGAGVAGWKFLQTNVLKPGHPETTTKSPATSAD